MIVQLESVFNDVRRKAFDHFLTRDENFGSPPEDWLKAIRAAVPGFNSENLHVQVLPELVVVEGKVEAQAEGKMPKKAEVTPNTEPPKIHFSEFESKRLTNWRLPLMWRSLKRPWMRVF